MNDQLGKLLIISGIIIIVVGVIVTFLPKTGGIPRLPGDILIKRDNVTFYFPWVTSLLISGVLTFLFYLFSKK